MELMFKERFKSLFLYFGLFYWYWLGWLNDCFVLILYKKVMKGWMLENLYNVY